MEEREGRNLFLLLLPSRCTPGDSHHTMKNSCDLVRIHIQSIGGVRVPTHCLGKATDSINESAGYPHAAHEVENLLTDSATDMKSSVRSSICRKVGSGLKSRSGHAEELHADAHTGKLVQHFVTILCRSSSKDPLEVIVPVFPAFGQSFQPFSSYVRINMAPAQANKRVGNLSPYAHPHNGAGANQGRSDARHSSSSGKSDHAGRHQNSGVCGDGDPSCSTEA
mmetsp:Transcript_57667/g.124692  ORF Transcript_57667/g.124692 Transcript_57667/m.124692 type:complete len:223 (+) Transcript_57667:471-1139(+)